MISKGAALMRQPLWTSDPYLGERFTTPVGTVYHVVTYCNAERK